jgi:hypothetical protein
MFGTTKVLLTATAEYGVRSHRNNFQNGATMKGSVEREFETARTTFFPRWDRRRQWRVEGVRDLDGAHGKCFPETKTLKMLDGITGLDLTALLIHEIAHASQWLPPQFAVRPGKVRLDGRRFLSLVAVDAIGGQTCPR